MYQAVELSTTHWVGKMDMSTNDHIVVTKHAANTVNPWPHNQQSSTFTQQREHRMHLAAQN
jgi:hypothetical protein